MASRGARIMRMLNPENNIPEHHANKTIRNVKKKENKKLQETTADGETMISRQTETDVGLALPGTTPRLTFHEKRLNARRKLFQEEDIDISDAESLPSLMYDSDADPEYLPSPLSYSGHSCSDDPEDVQENVKEKFVFGTSQESPQSRNRRQVINEEEEDVLSASPIRKSTSFPVNIHDNSTDEDICGTSQGSSRLRNQRQPRDEKEKDVNEQGTRKKNKNLKNPDYCPFCDDVISSLNFARHLQRNHTNEIEVQKLLSLPKMSKERRELINSLRKKGNYIQNCSKTCMRPVRKPNGSSDFNPEKYLPCVFCFGFFAKKQLWRHKKRCSKNLNNINFKASDAQSFLVRRMDVDTKLRRDVFPHMAPNENSLAAKKDPLICAFGARYLKTHRGKHHIPVCSRKMQELAKLLSKIKMFNPNVKSMMDCLKPEHYDLLVDATKQIAGYNDEKEVFRAPTFAMNIVKSVKDCCDIAMTLATKGDVTETQNSRSIVEDLKTYLHLLNANWKYDVSSLASTNLQMNKWNKLTLVPLATNIKLLKDHLTKEGIDASIKLRRNPENVRAYRQLLEVVYCRVILLNRKRPGELERLRLSVYDSAQTRDSYEEFNDALTMTEKVLASHFKRVVFEGKRNRGVPVLFPKDVQEYIDLLKESRPNHFMGVANPYLFGIPGKGTPISGYKTLEKFAITCGAKNPNALKATKLRKHLATITQLFDMNDNEIEQLANFMGHTEGIHRGEYRLPDDVYQTAKICKLLLMMESGEAAQYKGMKLNDINIDLEEDLLNVDAQEDDENFVAEREEQLCDTSFTSQTSAISSPQELLTRKKKKQKGTSTMDQHAKTGC